MLALEILFSEPCNLRSIQPTLLRGRDALCEFSNGGERESASTDSATSIIFIPMENWPDWAWSGSVNRTPG